MKDLRWGLMTASLSAALILGGTALAQTAQRPEASPSANPPSTTAPDNSAKPMSEEPGMSNPQATQDQQANPQVNDQTRDRDQNRDRDNMGQNPSRTDRDPLSANGESKAMHRDVKEFDQFLDKHPEVSQELRNDPSKINDTAFLNNHKELQRWLEKHPQVRDEIRENPSAFMHQENRYDKNENKNNSVPQ
jgi:hypothetical protein